MQLCNTYTQMDRHATYLTNMCKTTNTYQSIIQVERTKHLIPKGDFWPLVYKFGIGSEVSRLKD